MSGKKLASPNDSLMQSTREPSTRSGDRTSMEFSSTVSQKRVVGGSMLGGGSYNSYIIDHLTRMHADIESTTRKLELEQRRFHQLNKQWDDAGKEYEAKRAKYRLYQSAQDDKVHKKKTEVRALEKRLEKAIAELNQGQCENLELREKIDQLRKERKILDTCFKQLERDIGGNEKTMIRVQQGFNESKLYSEEAKQKSKAQTKALERDRRTFQKDCERLQKAMVEESEVQKEQENLQRAPPRGQEASGKAHRPYMIADEEEAFSEQSMHRRILKLSFLNTIQRRHIKQHQKNIEVFEQAFATIKSSTGISDIEEIVKIFVALEQRNFSLLTYVNTLNREIESLDIRNRDLKGHIDDHASEQTNSQVRKNHALSELVTQIQKTKAATEGQDKQISDAAEALKDCRPMIWEIVKYLKTEMPPLVTAGYEGDPPPMKATPGDEHEENPNNYLLYIEDQVMQFRICLAQDRRWETRPPIPAPQTGARKNEIRHGDLPPANLPGDDSDDDPDAGLGERPWTRNELKDRAMANIQRRRARRPDRVAGHPGVGAGLAPGLTARGGGAGDVDDMPGEMRAGGPPPPREHGGSSAASKEEGSGSGKKPSEGQQDAEEGEDGDRKAMWWRENQKGKK